MFLLAVALAAPTASLLSLLFSSLLSFPSFCRSLLVDYGAIRELRVFPEIGAVVVAYRTEQEFLKVMTHISHAL